MKVKKTGWKHICSFFTVKVCLRLKRAECQQAEASDWRVELASFASLQLAALAAVLMLTLTLRTDSSAWCWRLFLCL